MEAVAPMALGLSGRGRMARNRVDDQATPAMASRASPRSCNKYHCSPDKGSMAVAFSYASYLSAVVVDDDRNIEEEVEDNHEKRVAVSMSLMALQEQMDIHFEAFADGGAFQCGTISTTATRGSDRKKRRRRRRMCAVCAWCGIRA